MAQKRKKKKQYEFRPDPTGTSFVKKLHLTNVQRTRLLKWSLYSILTVLLLVIQDVIMSQFRLSGATTDLVICIILLIGIFEGMEKGGLFALFASVFYWFSGSAPGPYVIALLTALTVLVSLFRQVYWRRSFSSNVLCTGIAIIVYEMLLFVIGIFLGLTIWARAGVFFLTAVLTIAVMLPLYPLVNLIAKIGGDTWKE